MYAAGCTVDWRPHFADNARSVALPSYPWQRERFWTVPSRASALRDQLFPSQRSGAMSTIAADQAWRNWFYAIEWTAQPTAPGPITAPTPVNGTWVVLADEKGIGGRLAARLESAGARAVLVYASRSQPVDDASLALDLDDGADYDRVWAAIGSSGPVRGVIHLWSLDLETARTLSSLEAAERRGCGSLLHLVQAIARSASAMPPLWLVSRGAQAVGDSRTPINVAHAPAWGLLRSLDRELSDLRSVRIDLDPTASADDSESIWRELSGADEEVAFRSGTRYVARLQRASAERQQTASAPARPRFRSDVTYLITGGLGALGLQVARAMTTLGARHLVLTGRRAPGPDAQAALEHLRAAGANIVVRQADVAVRSDVERLLAEVAASLPPLSGIVHTAGVLDDGVLVQQDWARFERVMAPKVGGAWNLHELTAGLPLDFFVLFSSASAVLGSAGQTNYAAANAFMDALAHERRAHGLPAVSINWGAWSVSGMAASLEERDRKRWSEQGMAAMDPAAALGAFLELLESERAQIAVLDMDWDRYGEQAGRRPFLDGLCQSSPHQASAPAAPAGRLRQEIEGAQPRARRNVLRDRVREHALKVLGLPPSFELDDRQGLRGVGLDSLLALELRNRLQSDVAASLPATFAFDFPTVADMTRHLADDVLLLGSPAVGVAEQGPAADAALDELDQMSDEMAEALLNAELSGARANVVKQG